jgi:hypothetical protein
MNMKPTDRPQRESGYYMECIDDEILLFHPGRTEIVYCNETASLIWQLCDGERTVQELIDLLADAYPEAGPALADDVLVTLQRLAEHGAVTVE